MNTKTPQRKYPATGGSWRRQPNGELKQVTKPTAPKPGKSEARKAAVESTTTTPAAPAVKKSEKARG